MTIKAAAIAAGLVFVAPISSRAAAPAAATDFTKADLDRMIALGPVDHQGEVVDAGKLNLGISVVVRNAMNKPEDAPLDGLVDTQTSKVYTIVAGSGTLVTGGKLVDQKPQPQEKGATTPIGGASFVGVMQGGVARKLGVGDMVIIPAGVSVGWKQIPDHLSYVVVRADPDHVLQAGYVNPALK